MHIAMTIWVGIAILITGCFILFFLFAARPFLKSPSHRGVPVKGECWEIRGLPRNPFAPTSTSAHILDVRGGWVLYSFTSTSIKWSMPLMEFIDIYEKV